MRRLSLLLLLAACRAPAPHAAPVDAGPGDAGPPDAGRLPEDGGEVALTRWVAPFIGTGEGAPDYNLNNAGAHLFPGAVAPFGMVQLSPDTTTGAGGYRYRQRSIRGFSATHFSGRGISCYQEFPVLPWVGELPSSPGTHWTDYASAFDHASERARPGYYRVRLDGPGVVSELSATARTGIARFTFPATDAATLLVNAGGSANGNFSPGTNIRFASAQELEGSAVSGNCGGAFTYQLFYVARFERAPSAHGTWAGDSVTPGADAADHAQSGAYLVFDATRDREVVMKFGLSWVSVEKARANLDAESPGWDLDAVAAATEADWNGRLNAVQVAGGTDDQRTVFYTALYHALIHPSVFSDADGEYLGFDGNRHLEPGHLQFHNFPGWDNYRSQMRLLPLLFPQEAGWMGQSLVNDAQQDPGGGLPRWEHANRNSGGMVGDSQDVVLASLHAFGARFDAEGALAAMRKGAEDTAATSTGHPIREGLDQYLGRGYVADDHWGSASLTLEYASDDFAISRLAAALGHDDIASTYLARSRTWRTLVDPSTGWPVPRRAADGSFHPTDLASQDGWVEGSGGQYAWMVPFDPAGLFAAMGGLDAARARLDEHTRELNAGPGSPRLFLGNEPELGTPWLYDWAGQPWKTQSVVRDGWLGLFGTDPGGYPGNDDGGALASWVVFSALGLYPAVPGVAGFAVGSPLFPEARVRLGGRGTLHILAPAAAADAPYVQRLSVDGAEHPSPWLPWERLAQGAELRFELGTEPDTTWGADPALAPPSYQ